MRSAAFDNWSTKARAVRVEDETARRGIKLRGKVERVGPCPVCGGEDRFSINTKKNLWNCRQCGVGGDVIALVEHLDSVDFIGACTTLTGEPAPKANGRGNASKVTAKKIVTAMFEYCDGKGNIVYVIERVEHQNADGTFVLTADGKRKKAFRQRRPDPEHPGEWLWNVDGVPVVPYRLPQLIEAIAAGHPVLIVEGEPKADLLSSWNTVATCNAGGAKKWKPEHSAFLKDADVVLVPDNDDIGWQHANVVGASLVGIAKRIRVLVLPGLQPKGDVIDWAKAGGTHAQLDAMLDAAQDWKPPSADKTSDPNGDEKAKAKAREDELLAALAKTEGLDYERQRKAAAKEFGVSASAIDREVTARREDAQVAPLYGHWIVEPWPEPVDGDSLLRDIIRRIQRHVVITYANALSSALWLMLAWVHEAVAIHSPILNINSADPISGKSTLLDLIALLMPKCIASVEASEAAIYRAIKRWQPSFCFDEFDSILVNDDKAALRSVINSGHTRGQGVLRCIGDDKVPELFPTFAPKAIGMIGRRLPPATLSRCIFIELRRCKDDEHFEQFKRRDDSELADLRRRLRRWSMDNEDALRNATPSMPAGLRNRCADNWALQLAIADLCSGAEDFGDKARAAAIKIEAGSDIRTANARALAATKAIFESVKGDAISSSELVRQITADDNSDWAEWKAGKPITQVQLARLLKTYGITPEQVRIDDRQCRGYLRARFIEAWERYT